MNIVAHNISAMNVQRQFNINVNSKSKTTEKLSSGYRINRAADDAAGLSISEKMRSQIRGLNQGSRNSQDGISFCQTADGALTEVHAMLQRVTELTVQSATGTNSNVQRSYIQEEINQIVEEIDRISENTKFNGMKIFDLSNDELTEEEKRINDLNDIRMGVSASIVAITNYGSRFLIKKQDTTGLRVNGNYVSFEEIKHTNGTSIADAVVPGEYSFESNKVDFTFSINREGHTLEDISQALDGVKVELNKEPLDFKVDLSSEDGEMSNSWIVKDEVISPERKEFYSGEYHRIEVRDNGEIILNTYPNAGDYNINYPPPPLAQSVAQWGDAANKDSVQFPDIGVVLRFESMNFETFQDAANEYRFTSGLRYRFENESHSPILDDGCVLVHGALINGSASIANLWFRSNDNVAFENKYGVDTKFLPDLEESGSVSFIVDDVEKKLGIQFDFGNGITDIIYGSESQYNCYLEYMDKIAPGTEIDRQENEQFSWNNEEITVGLNLSTLEPQSSWYNNGLSFFNLTAEKLQCYSYYPVLTSSEPYKVTGVEYYETNLLEPEEGDLNTPVSVDLWIQSGAEKDSGMYLSIDRMDANILGMRGYDLSTQENAQQSLEKVNSAIEIVSKQRSKIGAQQNRLEHTIKNTENIAENTQAAEARIRDTNLAKEMIEYSSKEILMQAGQSMLAQANNANEDVLALLQS